jgi:beta-N-acetylhexosaminidase
MTADAQRETPPSDSVLTRFMLGFEGNTLPADLADYIARGLAGIAIYACNYRSLGELRALTGTIRDAAARPVLIGIDQEGGSRFALKEPFTQWPSPEELGRVGGQLDEEDLVQRVAHAMALELRAAGCNMDFAPMLDLHMNRDSPVTKDRSFGADPQHVARMGLAFHRGLREGGVLSCAKHFPGHGDTNVDPHLDLPVFAGTMERLEAAELVPFATAIAGGIPVVMTAHILLPRIDPEKPASLSRKILHAGLRGRMGFDGVILADDLGMGAIARRIAPGEACIEAIRAGTDIVMLCHDWTAVAPAISAVTQEYENGMFDEAEWLASLRRIERVRILAESNLQPPPMEIIGCVEHRRLAEEIWAQIKSLPPGI